MKTGINFSHPGFFLTFEGVEGCGKSTQIHLLEKRLLVEGFSVFRTREPGGPPISEKIRDLLLDPANDAMQPLAEALLYQASRAQHVLQWIRPYLEQGYVVMCDRFFDASTAYQGVGRDLGKTLIQQLNLIATGGLQPDLTIIIDLPVEVGLQRGRKKSIELFPDGTGDRMERESVRFHNRVRQAYLELAESEERVVLIDGQQSIPEIEAEIYQTVYGKFEPKLSSLKTRS